MQGEPGPASEWTTIETQSAELLAAESFDGPLASAEKACKECSRRKVKCDRTVPICGICSKYRRHCLYDKYTRTPLTRKHLTEVEERLERAERLLRQERAKSLLAQNASRTTSVAQSTRLDPPTTHSFEGVRSSASGNSPNMQEKGLQPNSFRLDRGQALELGDMSSCIPTTFLPAEMTGDFLDSHDSRSGVERHDSPLPQADQNFPYETLDGPPLEADNFEWDEQNISERRTAPYGCIDKNPVLGETADEESSLTDGMASLTTGENETGYFGVASGAALLKALVPSPAGQPKYRSNTTRRRLVRSYHTFQSNNDILEQPNPNRCIASTMIDGYFKYYNTSYPIVHEPTFRAQFSEVIERPNGDCWKVLAYAIAAIGVFSTANSTEDTDLLLFAEAKSLMRWTYMESGNLTLVQALTLMSNYLQKRDKPNSGYNYLGLAQRMAMGIGLHKEFSGWAIQPLKMEVRRRVWWCICVFDIGATITFGRPISWPWGGIDVGLPGNFQDLELTAVSKHYPPPAHEITPYTALRAFTTFYLAANPIYSRIITKPFPSAGDLIDMDDKLKSEWLLTLPSFFAENASIPSEYHLAHAIMMWKYRNLKIIIYRPYVMKQAIYSRHGYYDRSLEGRQAYDRCLYEARSTILSINEFWNRHERTRIGAWYALYFLFQAALIPCICLRNEPTSPNADDWRHQLQLTLETINATSTMNPSSEDCYAVIMELCGSYIGDGLLSAVAECDLDPINESPQTQMNHVYPMFWPNLPVVEADASMQEDAWTDLFPAEAWDSQEYGG